MQSFKIGTMFSFVGGEGILLSGKGKYEVKVPICIHCSYFYFGTAAPALRPRLAAFAPAT